MKMQSVVSGLMGGPVLLIAGAAASDATATSNAQLVSFDRAKGELWATAASDKLTSYVTQGTTTFVSADLRAFVPPDPCFQVARAWNFTVAYDQKNSTKSTFVYELLLGSASELACRFQLTSLTSGTPQPLVSIQPTK